MFNSRSAQQHCELRENSWRDKRKPRVPESEQYRLYSCLFSHLTESVAVLHFLSGRFNFHVEIRVVMFRLGLYLQLTIDHGPIRGGRAWARTTTASRYKHCRIMTEN